MTKRPTLVSDLQVPDVLDPAALVRLAYEGGDVSGVIYQQLDLLERGGDTAIQNMNLGLLFQLVGQRERALSCQDKALAQRSLYRVPARQAPRLRLLAFVTRGDLMTNTPFELMVEGRDIDVVKLYVSADGPLPEQIPDHDLAMVAISEGDHTRDVLYRLHALTLSWPRPVLNRPLPIMETSRDRLFRLLAGDDDGLFIPRTVRVLRHHLTDLAAGTAELAALLPGGAYPIIIRPTTSHAGAGLELLESAEDLRAYLGDQPGDEFHLSRFIDYHGPNDAHFRKYRIAFIGGQPQLCHLAIGDHWMVHYLNAGMAESETKRAEEARAMVDFADGFAKRHEAAFAEMVRRVGLDYFIIDCAEAPDGRLLVFEASTAMIVHALDGETLYPYKRPHMQNVFAAFAALLHERGQKQLS